MSDQLHAMRHSAAHVLAAAVQKLYPGAKFGVGPVIEHGFYYDVAFEEPISDKDLKRVQKEMRSLVKRNLPIEREEWPIEQAIEYFQKNNQPFKVELLRDLQQHGTTSIKNIDSSDLGIDDTDEKITTVSVYRIGDFVDLCRGPHVATTGEVKAFELTRLAGAYWRGDETRDQLQRIYGIAFASQEELDQHKEMLELAKERDHRKLGRELDLFTFSDLVGPGLPLWTPRGTVVRNELDRFVQELRHEYGFEEVTIPHITKKDLYVRSGHWEKFEDELFKITSRDGHEFALKPMNCPHHTQIFDSKPRSYREMPVRYRETTMVYRDEQSGELHGLSRVRSITQDDAHTFCRPSQVEAEVMNVWDVIERYWKVFGINLRVRLSTHDPENMKGYLGTEQQWQSAVAQLQSVIERKGVAFELGTGEAAFYGPKIDFIGSDALGREFQASTVQLDFNMPERFDLACIDESGNRETVVMIHCAIAGSVERSIVLLLEHFGGNFPVWLAPQQVAVLPISEKFIDYAEKITTQLRELGVRAELSGENESLGKRIRAAEIRKTPFTLIVGEREAAEGTVAVRRYGEGDLGAMKADEFTEKITSTIAQRSL
ncbi:MAG: threonyl-tRNA synthetase [Patescibacteria group bacterium]|nr:threonyl-tRNA synthetase [Patescibacteria group bacterium]